MAERLKAEMSEKHPDCEGLKETYEIVPSDEEDEKNGKEEEKVGVSGGRVLESKKTGITRQSLLKAAHDSVYSGSDFQKMYKKKPTPSQGGTSYAPTDLDHQEITPDLSPQKTLKQRSKSGMPRI